MCCSAVNDGSCSVVRGNQIRDNGNANNYCNVKIIMIY